MADGDYSLEIRDLVVRYGQHTVLNGVSCAVRRGERVAILGPSGAGKTSLLRAINGFVPAASGSILVDDIEVTVTRGRALRELRSRIGVISQRHDLVDNLGGPSKRDGRRAGTLVVVACAAIFDLAAAAGIGCGSRGSAACRPGA